MNQASEKRSMLTLNQHLYIKSNNIHQTFFTTHAYTTANLYAPLTLSVFFFFKLRELKIFREKMYQCPKFFLYK